MGTATASQAGAKTKDDGIRLVPYAASADSGELTCKPPKNPPSRMTDREHVGCQASQAGAKTKDDGIRLVPNLNS